MDMDSTELYDLLFYKILCYAEALDKQFHVYFYGDNIFKFLKYKLKDKSAKFLSVKKVMLQNTKAKKYSYSLLQQADYKIKVVEECFDGMQLEINGKEEDSLF